MEESSEYVLHSVFGDGTLYNSYPTYLAFSVRANRMRYLRLPLEKEAAEKMVGRLRSVFENPDKILISNDVKNDIIWLRRAGIEIKNRIFDIKIAHYVLQPDSSHELERIALELLNYRLVKEMAAIVSSLRCLLKMIPLRIRILKRGPIFFSG